MPHCVGLAFHHAWVYLDGHLLGSSERVLDDTLSSLFPYPPIVRCVGGYRARRWYNPLLVLYLTYVQQKPLSSTQVRTSGGHDVEIQILQNTGNHILSLVSHPPLTPFMLLCMLGGVDTAAHSLIPKLHPSDRSRNAPENAQNPRSLHTSPRPSATITLHVHHLLVTRFFFLRCLLTFPIHTPLRPDRPTVVAAVAVAANSSTSRGRSAGGRERRPWELRSGPQRASCRP